LYIFSTQVIDLIPISDSHNSITMSISHGLNFMHIHPLKIKKQHLLLLTTNDKKCHKAMQTQHLFAQKSNRISENADLNQTRERAV